MRSKNLTTAIVGSIVAVLAVTVPSPSQAGEWEILYMANTGGSRLWITEDPAEAIEIVAKVASPDGAVLVTSCRSAPEGTNYLAIGQGGETDGPQFMGERSSVSFRVDDNPPRAASDPEYLQSAYYVIVPDALLQEMSAGNRLVMRYGTEPHQRKIFSLRGSQRALSAVDCNPLE